MFIANSTAFIRQDGVLIRFALQMPLASRLIIAMRKRMERPCRHVSWGKVSGTRNPFDR
jgi:hypothetical protein